MQPYSDHRAHVHSPPTLSVCVIARNEEDALAGALKSIRRIADEVVVVDTGSTDDTIGVAEENGARVITDPWKDHFSAARNRALESATGEWILCLDADERVVCGQERRLKRLISSRSDAYYVRIRSPMTSGGKQRLYVHSFPRLFRNRPHFRFAGRVHEQIYTSLMERGAKIDFSDLEIEHLGYAVDSRRQEEKLRRNLRLLKLDLADSPTDGLIHFHLAETYALLRMLESALESYRCALHCENLPTAHRTTARTGMASVFLQLRRLEEAIDECDRVLAADSRAAEALLIRAAARTRRNDSAKAIQDINLYLDLGRRTDAAPSALQGFAVDLAQAHFIRGECLLRLGRLDQAEADGRRAVGARPEWGGGHRLLARIAVAVGEDSVAEEEMRQAIECDSSDSKSICDLALLQARRGDLAEARHTIKGASGRHECVEVLSCQGHMNILAQDWPAAVKCYERVLRIQPQSAEARRRLAGLHRKMGNFEQARSYLSDACPISRTITSPPDRPQDSAEES